MLRQAAQLWSLEGHAAISQAALNVIPSNLIDSLRNSAASARDRHELASVCQQALQDAKDAAFPVSTAFLFALVEAAVASSGGPILAAWLLCDWAEHQQTQLQRRREASVPAHDAAMSRDDERSLDRSGAGTSGADALAEDGQRDGEPSHWLASLPTGGSGQAAPSPVDRHEITAACDTLLRSLARVGRDRPWLAEPLARVLRLPVLRGLGRAGKAGDTGAFALCSELWDAVSPGHPTRELVLGDGWGLAAWLDLASRSGLAGPDGGHSAAPGIARLHDRGGWGDLPGSLAGLTPGLALQEARARGTVVTRDAAVAAGRLRLALDTDHDDSSGGEEHVESPRPGGVGGVGGAESGAPAPRRQAEGGVGAGRFAPQTRSNGVWQLLAAAREAELQAEGPGGGGAGARRREEAMQSLWLALADLAATPAESVSMAELGGLLPLGMPSRDGAEMQQGPSAVLEMLELCPQPRPRAAYTIAGVLRAASGRAASHRLLYRVLFDLGALQLCMALSPLPREPPVQQLVDASTQRTAAYVNGDATSLVGAETLFAVRTLGLVRSGKTVHRLLAWLERCGMGLPQCGDGSLLLQALMCCEVIGDAEAAFACMRAGARVGTAMEARHIMALHRCLLRNGDADGIAALAASSLVDGMEDLQERLLADHDAITRAFGKESRA